MGESGLFFSPPYRHVLYNIFVIVPPQLDMYSKKFDEFQGTVSKSNTVYSSFKQDMDKVRTVLKDIFEVSLQILVGLFRLSANKEIMKTRLREEKRPMRFTIASKNLTNCIILHSNVALIFRSCSDCEQCIVIFIFLCVCVCCRWLRK